MEGQNASELFPDVVKLVSTTHLELKKLVYMYVVAVDFVVLRFRASCLLRGLFFARTLAHSLARCCTAIGISCTMEITTRPAVT